MLLRAKGYLDAVIEPRETRVSSKALLWFWQESKKESCLLKKQSEFLRSNP